jgi:acyl carrier protein
LPLSALGSARQREKYMALFPKVQQLIATTLKISPFGITRNTKDSDIAAWDSLAHVNLMMSLEQTFELFLEVEDFSRLTSVPAILDYLGEHGKS